MRRTAIAACLAAAGLVLTAGCGFGGGDGGDAASAPPTRASTSPGDSAPSDSAPSDSASADGVASPAATGAVSAGPATHKVTYPALGKDGTVTVSAGDLKVDGRLAELTVSYQPHQPGSTGSWNVSQMSTGSSISGGSVTMLDNKNLKRYLVVRDSGGDEVGKPSVTEKATNDRPLTATYTFAAPPDGVTSLGVYLDSRRLFDVTVQR